MVIRSSSQVFHGAGSTRAAHFALPGALLTVWAISIALAVWSPGTAHGPLRLVLTIALMVVAAYVIRHDRRWLVSPLFALGATSVVFYAVGPSLFLSLAPGGLGRPGPTTAALDYLSGEGELLVLQFSALCLAVVTALTGRTHNDSATTQPRDYRNALRIATPYCAALLIVAVLALFAERFIGGVEAFADAGIGKQLFHAFPPLMAFSLAVFAATAALCGGRWMVVAALAAAVAMATTFATDFVKPALFAVTASLLLFMGLAWLRAATILAVLGSIAGLLVVAAILVTLARSGQSLTPSFLFSDRSANFIGGALAYKLFARQAATGGCLQRVIDRHLPAAEPGSPFYFLIAPVPRVLWPDKPNLSLGADYGVRYCDIPPTQPGAPIHSASITLLGEPIIQAGVPGLIVAQGLTIGVLAGITLICFRGGLLGLITLAALFPWLADFDQSFALYVANAIKMGLYILPALLVLAWLLRRYGQADTGWVQP